MLSTEQINLHLLLNKLKRLELLKKCKERNKNKTESLETKINNEVLELIDEKYIDNFFNESIYNCSLCNKKQFNSSVTSKPWKHYKELCDTCWISFEEERQSIWKTIKNNTNQYNCSICNKSNPNERHHYDHLNCFDKKDNIFMMINRGDNLEQIMDEVNKCQLVCISCHSMITKFERKFSFINIKKNINKKFIGDSALEEYSKHKDMYAKKMNNIYDALKNKTMTW